MLTLTRNCQGGISSHPTSQQDLTQRCRKMENLPFYLGFATLIAHELDAMTQGVFKRQF